MDSGFLLVDKRMDNILKRVYDHSADWRALVVLAMGLVAAGSASAQVRGATQPEKDPRREHSGAKITAEPAPGESLSSVSDEARLDDSYQPKGMDLGLFLFLPKLEVDETYTSNLYALENDARSDLVTTVRPELKFRSRFKEHALNFSLFAEQFRHRRFVSDNRTDAQAEVDGRYDFSSETQATYFGQVFSRHEERGSPDDARGVEPTPISGFVNRGGVKHQFGRFIANSEIGVDRRLFEDVATAIGTSVPNSDRNRWELLARQRLSYEIFPGYAAVGEVSANSRTYDQQFDRSNIERSSYGYRVDAGLGVDISQLLRGDFLVGYFAQDYEDARLDDPQGLSVRASFNWTPTKITIIIPALERAVNETTSQGASAMVRNSANLTVRHELARNIILTGYGSVAYDELTGVKDQNAWTYEGRAKAIYAFSPEAFAGTELAHRRKRSEAVNGSFDQSTIMVRLGLQY